MENVPVLKILTPEDWQTWRALRLEALEQAPEAFEARTSDWKDAGEDRWRNRLALPGSRNLIAIVAGAPVAMASGVCTGPATVEIISLWVRPEARGLGVGDLLLQRLSAWARDIGARRVELRVRTANEHAIRLYERNGLRLTDGSAQAANDEVTFALALDEGP